VDQKYDQGARECLPFCADVFPAKGNFLPSNSRPGIARSKKGRQSRIGPVFPKKQASPLVATNDCHYPPTTTTAHAQEVLLCIQTGKTHERHTNRMKFSGTDQFYFKRRRGDGASVRRDS